MGIPLRYSQADAPSVIITRATPPVLSSGYPPPVLIGWRNGYSQVGTHPPVFIGGYPPPVFSGGYPPIRYSRAGRVNDTAGKV